jgi:hypothetical protein
VHRNIRSGLKAEDHYVRGNQTIVRNFFNELWNNANLDAVDNPMDTNCDSDFHYLTLPSPPASRLMALTGVCLRNVPTPPLCCLIMYSYL